MADMMYGTNTAGTEFNEDNNADFYGSTNSNNINSNNNNNNNNRQRFPGLYVGNLTWWTTDQDVINNINGIGVHDVQEVKFFENRNNGQSKGFCVVTFASDASLPIVMEKLPRTELHGQNPVVTPYNRQNLNLFESQTKTRPQINSSNSGAPTNTHAAGIMGISSISGVHAGTQGLPYSATGGGAGPPNVMGGMGGMNNNYNQQGAGGMNNAGMLSAGAGGGVGGPRGPSNYHANMWMQMRAPRPMRGPLNPNSVNPNGPMMPGVPGGVGVHQMNRMRFMQPQQGMWNNSQTAYNNPNQSRLGQPDDRDIARRMDDRDMSRRGEERSSSSSRHRDDLRRGDDRSSPSRHREDMRRDDRSPPRHREDSRRADERSSSSSRHRDADSRRGDERSSRREKEASSSSSSRRDKGHHRSLDHKTRSRSRDRSRDRSSRDRSRERKDRKDSSRRDRLSTRNIVSSGHYIH